MSNLPIYPVKDDKESDLPPQDNIDFDFPANDDADSDYSKDDAIIKWTRRLTTAIVGIVLVCVVGGIMWYSVYDDYFAWKKDAEAEKANLKTYFSKMPDYDKHSEYMENMIDAQHELIFPTCKRHVRTSDGSYYRFNRNQYLFDMNHAIYQNVNRDNKEDIIKWMDRQEKKRRKEYDEQNWYRNY